MTNIEEIRTLPVEQAAVLADCCLRQIESDFRSTFAELGVVVLVSRERELWKYAPLSPKTFTDWLQDCLPVSNGTAFAALRVAEKLADIPLDERKEIPRSNLERLAKMAPSVRVGQDLDLQRAARQLNPSAFGEYVEREFPLLHIPSDSIMRFRVSGDARAKVDEALKRMMEVYECGRDEAFVFVCEFYLLTEEGLRVNKSNVIET